MSETRTSPDPATLDHERALFAYPPRSGVVERTAPAESYDVLIVGAGQAGTSIAARLLREGVGRLLVVDRAPRGEEGPWITWARMETLRTQKDLTGPDAGYAHATFQSWYRATRGDAAWDALGLIPKETWAEYLLWVRDALGIPVENGTAFEALAGIRSVDGIDYAEVLLRSAAGEERTVLARKIVVASGMLGSGTPRLPAFTADLDRSLWMHTSERRDLSELAGKRVAVLGGGASAFDNAAAALEAGALEVTQFVRRSRIPEANFMRALEGRNLLRHHERIPDETKLRIVRRMFSMPMPPPVWSVERCTAHPNYRLRMGSDWQAVESTEHGIEATSRHGRETYDFAIIATGFAVDLRALGWLRPHLDDVRTWAESELLGDSAVDRSIAAHPYLAEGMRLQGRTDESDRLLRRVHLYGPAAIVSAGNASSGVNSTPFGVAIIVDRLLHDLLLEDQEAIVEAFEQYDEPEAPQLEAALLAGVREAELVP